eukprot:19236_1
MRVNRKSRIFVEKPVTIGYKKPKCASLIDKRLYKALSATSKNKNNILSTFKVPKKSGKAWNMNEGDICRVLLKEGSQVGDMNFWNQHNTKEHFYTGKTRQLESTHLSYYNHLWSNMPYLNIMATITDDSLDSYKINQDDNSGIHDVIGTRCDPYTHKLMNPNADECKHSCHQHLCQAIMNDEYNMNESDVHNVFNIFLCSGFTMDTHQYFIKGTPATIGDYIEFVANMDLIVALSACPYGDVSMQCGEHVPDEMCFGLDVEIARPDEHFVNEWKMCKQSE